MIILISAIVLLIGIGFLTVPSNKNKSTFFMIGLVFSLISVAFGFMLLGNTYPVRYVEVKSNKFYVLKTPNNSLISIDLKNGDKYTQTITDITLYNKLNDSSIVSVVYGINSYGAVVTKNINVK